MEISTLCLWTVTVDNLRGCSVHSFHCPLCREQVLDLGVDLLHIIDIIIVVMVVNIILVMIATCSWSSSSESCRPRAAFWYFFFSEVYLHKINFTDVFVQCAIFILITNNLYLNYWALLVNHLIYYLRCLCFVKLEPGAAKTSARLYFLPFLLFNSR